MFIGQVVHFHAVRLQVVQLPRLAARRVDQLPASHADGLILRHVPAQHFMLCRSFPVEERGEALAFQRQRVRGR